MFFCHFKVRTTILPYSSKVYYKRKQLQKHPFVFVTQGNAYLLTKCSRDHYFQDSTYPCNKQPVHHRSLLLSLFLLHIEQAEQQKRDFCKACLDGVIFSLAALLTAIFLLQFFAIFPANFKTCSHKLKET